MEEKESAAERGRAERGRDEGEGGAAPARTRRVTYEGEDHDGVGDGAEARDLEGLEGEGLLALELVEELEALETGRLLEVGRDLTGLATGACVACVMRGRVSVPQQWDVVPGCGREEARRGEERSPWMTGSWAERRGRAEAKVRAAGTWTRGSARGTTERRAERKSMAMGDWRAEAGEEERGDEEQRGRVGRGSRSKVSECL